MECCEQVIVKPFLLVNANTLSPPVSPVGLEYVAESLREHRISVRVVDLAFEADVEGALRRALAATEPLAVGIAMRNADDCSWLSATSFLPAIRQLVDVCHKTTRSPVVLGGGGFSVAPGAILKYTDADMGIAGDGEDAMVGLGLRLMRGEDPLSQPGLVFQAGRRIVANRRAPADLRKLPSRRRFFDNARYQSEGAMVGVETKRGCPMSCSYCADPVIRGRRLRLRPPAAVVEEMADLVAQGVTWFHLCDSEFNLSLSHARDVCQALISKGLAKRISWYAYCAPTPMDREILTLMVRAGCAGINFGVDSLSDAQLARLGRQHRLEDLARLTAWLRQAGLEFIYDLLLAGPGETPQTVRETVENARRLELPLVGVSLGVRVYPATPLARHLRHLSEGLYPHRPRSLHLPTFYLSPALGDDPTGLVRSLVGQDPRFLLLAKPQEPSSYNYAGDTMLARAIREGARGAYWHILARQRADS